MFDDWMHEGKVYTLKVKDGKTSCEGCAFRGSFDNCPRTRNENLFCDLDEINRIWIEKETSTKLKSDMLLPTDAQERKQIPITTGVLDYFPLAIAEVAKCSWAGNQQHHPDKELHWDKTKSTDHSNCIARHLIDRGKFDTDGQRHSAKLAWRALALLELELENERNQ